MTIPTTVRSACTKHCADACALLAEFRSDGRVLLRGHPDHPFTAGFICGKMTNYVQDTLRRPDRIVHPLIREGAGFRRASWDEAMGRVAAEIERLRATPERIFGFVDWASFGLLAQASRLVFGRLRAARHSGSPCSAAMAAAIKQDFGAHREPHWANPLAARHIVIWGRNLDAQTRHTGRVILQARRRGATVLTVSPGDKGYAAYSDRHVTLRPGADRFLAAAVLKLLKNEGRLDPAAAARCAGWPELAAHLDSHSLGGLLAACDVPLEQARQLADAYAAGPTASFVGRGMQRYAMGGENVRFVNALAMLSGNIGRPGGGACFSGGHQGHVSYDWYAAPEPPARTLPYADLGRALLVAEPPVEFVWTEGLNLVATGQDSLTLREALSSRFHVAVEPFMTDTAACATVILPPALMLETEDVCRGNASGFVLHSAQVLEPPGECRSNFAIAADLARRLGMDFPDPERVMAQALRCTSLEALRRDGWAEPGDCGAPWSPDADGGSFAHPDGRYRLPGALTPEPPAPAGYPLVLGSYVQKRGLLSSLRPRDMDGLPPAYVGAGHPVLDQLDLSRPVYAATPLGRMQVRLQTLDGLHPEVVLIHRGGWLSRGWGLNALIEPRQTDIGGQAAYYAQRCRLEN